MPRAFFGTFFRFERKYFPPRGGSPTTRAVVGASIPHRGKEDCACGRPKGFPRGKQSARFALPCAPLVVCLNSGSLTAFGGCIHWIPASLRSPLETFGHRSWRETHRTASPNPHCSRRIMPPVGNFLRQSCCSPTQAGGFPLAPCTPSVRPLKITPMGRQVPLPRRSRRVRPRRKISPRLNARTKKRKPHTPRRFRFPIYFRG